MTERVEWFGGGMARYLVKAKSVNALLRELSDRLSSGEISRMRPFGMALDELSVEEVNEGEGWKKINDLPSLWDSTARRAKLNDQAR